jgi:hypothetical protein
MTKRDKRRARLVVAAAGAAVVAVLARRPTGPGYRQSLFWRAYDGAAQALDRKIGWDRLPTPLGLLVLVGLRNQLRKHNLHDTTRLPAVDTPPVPPPGPRDLPARTADGTHNDLGHPSMGMAGSRFGRNVPIERTFPEPEPALLDPSPREVSRALLGRPGGKIQAAEAANALVAAWLQFMIRDWFSHGKSVTDNPWQIKLGKDDPWPHGPIQIMRTRPDPTRPPGPTDLAPTYVNTETHWWDGSQLYGHDAKQQEQLRSHSDGKLRIGPDGLPPHPADPDHDPTRVPGFWLGLALMQHLFALEHNAICDRLHAEYPSWSDDELFERARLVNAALLAKIHTVEWTPVVISHPTTRVALPANWYGLAGQRLYRVLGRLSSSEIVSGIPGSEPQHFGVPYALTEEFVAVYRMHPLIPDDYDFRSAADNRPIEQMTLREIAGPNALEVLAKIPLADLFYSFGTINPGLVTLHNYPRFLQEFERPDGKGMMDLAATDILRIRELGVPRYNEFRRLLRLEPAKDFESLTHDPVWAEELRRVYRGDVERVDLMVGMFAEPLPAGFAFSDTAFRIFILMASRRLNSDRFLTSDFTPEVYTPAGLDWIERTTMSAVLLRHYPQLRPALRSIPNAFMAWPRPNSNRARS